MYIYTLYFFIYCTILHLVIGFIFCFILRDFVLIRSEQNVFVVLQLGFLWASSLAIARNFTGSGPRRAPRHSVLCSVLCRLLRSVVSFIKLHTILEEAFLINFQDFKNYCFSLCTGNSFYTVLQHSLSFFSVALSFFLFLTILITYTILHILIKLVRRRFVKSQDITEIL